MKIIVSMFVGFLLAFLGIITMPAEYRSKIPTVGSDTSITIYEGDGVLVRNGERDDNVIFTVVVRNGQLEAAQVNKEGDMPIVIQDITPDHAKITITRGELPHSIIDENGDGLPDVRHDESGRSRVSRIIWSPM